MMHSTQIKAVPLHITLLFAVGITLATQNAYIGAAVFIIWRLFTDDWREVMVIYRANGDMCSSIHVVNDVGTPGKRASATMAKLMQKYQTEASDKGEPKPTVEFFQATESDVIQYWRVPKFLVDKKEAQAEA